MAVTPSPECLAFQCGPTGTWPEHDPARQSGEAGGKGAGAQDKVGDQLLTKRKTQTFRRQATGREASGRGAEATQGTVLRAASLEVWGVLQTPQGQRFRQTVQVPRPWGLCARVSGEPQGIWLPEQREQDERAASSAPVKTGAFTRRPGASRQSPCVRFFSTQAERP